MEIIVRNEDEIVVSDDFESKITKIAFGHRTNDYDNVSAILDCKDKVTDYFNEFLKPKEIMIEGLEDLIQEFNNLSEEYHSKYDSEFRGLAHREFKKNNNPEMLNEYLNAVYNLYEKKEYIYLLNDIKLAQKETIENMKYYCSEEQIKEFETKFDSVFKSKDINSMKSMIEKVNDEMREEWKKYYSDLASLKTGDPFRFIGHSTSSTKFDGDFYSRYVSCSLFTEQLTDTYRGGFGFIFTPEKIVNAKSEDTYTNNYTNDDEKLFNYTSIHTIDHPQRLIEETLKIKQENSNHNQKIYNEVVLDGFNPAGIFCFTDGSKSLDYNYRRAQELKKQFPNLEVININVLIHKQGNERKIFEKMLLERLYEKKFGNSIKINDYDLLSYRPFLEEYIRLVSKENYSEEDIMNLFDRHYEMNNRMMSLDELFSYNLDYNSIKNILDFNTCFNFNRLLTDTIYLSTINKICNLGEDPRLEQFYPGITKFKNICDYIELTPDVFDKLNQIKPRSFDSMSECLGIILKEQQESLSEKIDKQKSEYNALVSEHQNLSRRVERHQSNEVIINNKFKYKLFERSFESDHESYNRRKEDNANCEREIIELTEKLNALLKEKEELTVAPVKNQEIDSIDTEMEILKTSIEIYSKHPLLNKSKIDKAKLKLFELSSKKNNAVIEEDFNRSMRKINIEAELAYIKMDLERLKERVNINNERMNEIISDVKYSISEISALFGCDYEDIPKLINNAEQEENNYDYSIENRIAEIERLLNSLSYSINEDETMLEHSRKVA